MSRVPAAIDQLVSVFTAALTDVTVYDGPVLSGDLPVKRLYVGYDTEGVAAESDQSWSSSVGAGRRDESFSIHCMVAADDGDGIPKLARDSVYAVMDLVESTLRANLSLGFPSPTVCGIRNPTLTYSPDAAVGITARVSFDVHVPITRI